MSEILARIRVRETAGIRRFLYPLSALLPMNGISKEGLHLIMPDGQFIPSVVGYECGHVRLDFAVSLPPLAEQEYHLRTGAYPNATVPDPLHMQREYAAVTSVQERFAITFASLGGPISEVIYDGKAHLRGECAIRHNGVIVRADARAQCHSNPLVIAEEVVGHLWTTSTSVTACKSWATITHCLNEPKPNDVITLTLPLAVTSSTLICDFGVGGYVFGKLDKKAAEIVWRTEFGDTVYAKWSVATAGRTDYIGEVDTAEEFIPQRWFHLIDSDKALAVAITKLPPDCQEMTATLNISGDIVITFRLGETITGPAEFGVYYHFLNDVPAIAAATSPQSILLPPIVEVLPP